MKPDKINIIEGDWIDKTWWSKDANPGSVFRRLQSAGFKIFKELVLPFNRLYDDHFWGGLQSAHNIFLAKIDFRHWYYDDDEFQEYVRKVSSIKFPAVMLGDSPYGFEKPGQVSLRSFEKKLFDRTKILSQTIKNNHPETKIVSPSISLVDFDVKDMYLEYFLHNRNRFDVYSLDYTYDITEQSTASLTALLNEVLRVLPKDVWITRWAMSACDELVQNPFSIAPSLWKPLNELEASMRLKIGFETIESITGGRSKWFYSGCSKDEYHPSGKVIESLWRKHPHLYKDNSTSWNYSNFMGLITYKNVIKEPLLEALIELHEESQ